MQIRTLCSWVGFTLLLSLTFSSSALAGAGSPDPSFGTRGVAKIPQHSTAQSAVRQGKAVLLPDGRLAVPTFKTVFNMKRGVQTSIRQQSWRVTWLTPSGKLAGTSAWLTLPKNLTAASLYRTSDDHLLLVGTRTVLSDYYYTNVKSLYVARLTSSGALEPAPGATSAVVDVPIRSVPNIGGVSAVTTFVGATLAPDGRVYFRLHQSQSTNPGANERKRGPYLVVAIDPSVGLATGFAGGSLVVSGTSDARTSVAFSTAVDDQGRVLVATRSTRNGIAGRTQDMYVTRYTSSGSVDPTFAGGRLDLDEGNIDTAYSGVPSISTLRNGDILIRSDEETERDNVTSTGIELRRILSSGLPVTTFGTAGRSTLVFRRAKTSCCMTSSSWGDDGGEPYDLFEQPDGKLIVRMGYGGGAGYSATSAGSLPAGDVLRITQNGALDTRYEQAGFAHIDLPVASYVVSAPIGVDPQGRLVSSAWSYEHGYDQSEPWIVRLLGGDEPNALASIRLWVDRRTSCGATQRRACFDPDGGVQITGRALVAGKPLVGANVVISISRPRSSDDGYVPDIDPVVLTGVGGRFTARIPRTSILPGAWSATARMLATPSSQRVNASTPVHFVLGPRREIKLMRTVQRAQALAVAMSYVLDDSVETDRKQNPIQQCASIKACFGASDELSAMTSSTTNPAPGKAGLKLGRPGRYTVTTRVATPAFDLRFVITETWDDTTYTCQGDAAARKRWCPNGTWEDYFDDPFVTAGIDGEPFDY